MKEHVEFPKDYRIYVAISSGGTSPGGLAVGGATASLALLFL
jgi:hypothetical protein